MTISQNALQTAITQIGKEEIPRGSNWGADVKKYLNSVGINFPASWCMAFVYWCYDQNKPNPLIKTGGVLDHWRRAKPENKFTSPQVGDIFIMDHGGGLGHTGIIEKIEGTLLSTIEGNTNDTGSREGYEVCRRTRSAMKMKCYLRY